MYNRVDPITSITQKVEKGVQLFGAIKSAYDIGKTIAPYAVRIGAALLQSNIKMFNKAEAYARRGFVTMKHHAKEAYKYGRNVMSKMDYGYQNLEKLHNVAAPMLKDAGVHSKTSKVISDFDRIRDKVTGFHETASQAVSNVRKRVPELGL